MIERGRISVRQAVMLMFTAVIGTIFIFLPRTVLNATVSDGMLTLVGATFNSAIVFIFIFKLASRFPEQSYFEICQTVLGKYLGKLVGLLIVVGVLVHSGIMVRSLGEFFITIVMPETPLSFFIIAILMLATIAASTGIEGIGRLNEFWLPLILFSFFLIFSGAIVDWDFSNLKPLFLAKDIPKMLIGSISFTSIYIQAAVVLFFYPFIHERKGMLKYSYLSLLLSSIFLLLIYATVIGVFGKDLTKLYTWPTLELARNIRFSGFFERLEALFVIIWILLAFLKISVYIWAATLGSAQILGFKKYYSWHPFLLAVFIYWVAFLPNNMPEVLEQIRLWEAGGLTSIFGVLIPIILLLIAVVLGKGVKKIDKKE